MPTLASSRERIAWVCRCLSDTRPFVDDAPWVRPLWDGVRILAEALPAWLGEQDGQASETQSDALFDMENKIDLLSKHFEVMQRASALAVPRFMVAPAERVLNEYLGDHCPVEGVRLALVTWFQGRNYCTDNGAIGRELADYIDVYVGDTDAETSSAVLGQLRQMVLVACPCGSQDNALMHALLAHETAHYALSRLPLNRKGSTNAIELPPDGLGKAPRLEWADELLCDIIATQMLGPASAVALRHSILPQIGGTSHPPTDLRVEACCRSLTQQGYLAAPRKPADDAQKHLAALLDRPCKSALVRHAPWMKCFDKWVETISGLVPRALPRSEAERAVLERSEAPGSLLQVLLAHVPPLPGSPDPQATASALSAIWLACWVVYLDRTEGGLWERFSQPFASDSDWGAVRAQAALSNLAAKAIELLQAPTEVQR